MNKVWAGVGAVGGAIALVLGGQFFVSRAAAKEVDKAIDSVAEFVDIDYQRVNASLLGRGTRVKGIVISPVDTSEQYTIDEVVVYRYRAQNDIPTYLNMAVNGMQLSPAALGENAETLKMLGYDKAPAIDLKAEYEYEKDNQSVRLKKLKLSAEDVGNLDVSFHLSNLAWDKSTLESLPLSLIPVQLNEAEIVYRDDSFMPRMFDTTAAANGTSVKQVKQDLVGNLSANPEMAKMLGENQLKEIQKFIDNPEGFTINFAPEQPVPFSSLMAAEGTESMIEQLNIRFKAN